MKKDKKWKWAEGKNNESWVSRTKNAESVTKKMIKGAKDFKNDQKWSCNLEYIKKMGIENGWIKKSKKANEIWVSRTTN